MSSVLLVLQGTAAVKAGDEAPTARCRIEPRLLDVGSRPGPLIVRIELAAKDRTASLSPARAIEPGVHLSSVDGHRLPAPSDRSDGIEENSGARRFEDRVDPRTGLAGSNGVEEAVIRFDRPADGDPKTRGDGDAGDLLAMLLDRPDGSTAEVCVAGRAGGAPFECCDRVTIRNRGLRDLPSGPFPGRAGDRP